MALASQKAGKKVDWSNKLKKWAFGSRNPVEGSRWLVQVWEKEAQKSGRTYLRGKYRILEEGEELEIERKEKPTRRKPEPEDEPKSRRKRSRDDDDDDFLDEKPKSRRKRSRDDDDEEPSPMPKSRRKRSRDDDDEDDDFEDLPF